MRHWLDDYPVIPYTAFYHGLASNLVQCTNVARLAFCRASVLIEAFAWAEFMDDA